MWCVGATLPLGWAGPHCEGLPRAPGFRGSAVRGLSPLAACGMAPDQASNLSPLHWQADSQPLDPQGSCGSMSSLKGGLTEGLIIQSCVPRRRFLEDDKVSLSLQGKLMVLVTNFKLSSKTGMLRKLAPTTRSLPIHQTTDVLAETDSEFTRGHFDTGPSTQGRPACLVTVIFQIPSL